MPVPPRIRLTPDERKFVFLLASVTGHDPRTCAKAFKLGVDSVGDYEPRENIRRALADLQTRAPAST